MGKLNELTAVDAAAGIAAGDFTAEDLMADCLDRVAARDNEVEAWAYLNPNYAIRQARDADAALKVQKARGEKPAPLHGVPVGIKDVIDTVDMPTENGSPAYQGRRPQADAACVAALRAAGAVIMGKTVTTELANIAPSKTRNPHDLDRSPGGSSAGSGAGVADGQVTLALGTQTGGSVIRPASFNGIHGFKPTLGMIPRSGVLMQSHTLDTVGVYGRSLEDLALIADVLSLPDPGDAHSYRGSRAPLMPGLRAEREEPPRLAFIKTPAWPQADDEAQKAISAFVASLGETCVETEMPAPFDDILSLHATVMAVEDLAHYGPLLENSPELVSDMLKSRMAEAEKIRGDDYVKALLAREKLQQDFAALFENIDAVIALSAAGTAPRGFETTGNPAFNGPWTYLGLPCVSLPLLTVSDMPLGVQVIGPFGADAATLNTARWVERNGTS
ncbi:amidase [Hwanghaeella grinnelliae]|uniref:Amidase n=1 Tax=Hwanghaeella grinnelliae TaxID=2500179 RepID=A0A437QJW0_9PROT|nr:amidase [Hwanghaeella grinnelliae]RVU34799.1 amidase [Hwanghaeella grinnelliae]